MKKIIFIILILFSLKSLSQSFPKNNPEILLGKKVVVKEYPESQQKYHYRNFYEMFDEKEQEFGKNMFSKDKYSRLTDYQKLAGINFEVKKVYKVEKKYSDYFNEHVIELYNEKIGTVFYKYENSQFTYELNVVGGLNFPENYLCDEIVYNEDKFDQSKTWTSPMNGGIAFVKTEINGSKSIYMKIQTGSSTLSSVNGKGLILLLKNGKRIELKDEKIDVDVNKTTYVYSAFIKLSNDQIKLMTENLITDTRLYIHDSEIDEESAFIIQTLLKCISKK